MDAAAHRAAIADLRSSHEHLAGLVSGLSDAEIAGPSYCKEWSVAQVLSHLGSAAEINRGALAAALAGAEPPSRDGNQAIWARWDALPPAEMARQGLDSDEAHVSLLESIDDATLESFTMTALGREVDASGLAANRLFEHAMHTWDIEVSANPSANVQTAAVAMLVDRLPDRMGRLARGEKPAEPKAIAVTTTSPERSFVLSMDSEKVALEPGVAEGDGHLSITAEGLLRLAFGRLDPDHTPGGVEAAGAYSLDDLRKLFPGF